MNSNARISVDLHKMIIEQAIKEKLNIEFSPTWMAVENESHGHNVAKNAETHFKIVLVSGLFEGVRAVARHQHVYKVLKEELDGEVHALSLHLFTPEQWQVQGSVTESPNCMGGSKR